MTSKKLIKLDECDVSTENLLRNVQQQGAEREFREHSQNSRIIQQTGEAEREQVQGNRDAAVHSDLRDDSHKFAEDDICFTKY